MPIASPANPKIKHVVRLRTCSVRVETGEMIVEGYRECRRALDSGYRPYALFFCEELYLKNENEPALVADCERCGAELYACSRTAFLKMAYKDRPDGLLMTGPHIAKRLDDLKLPEHALVIVTEALEKPGNLGAILRTAEAAGVDAVIVCDPLTDMYNPNLIRASIGGVFNVPTAICTSEECITFLKANGIKILTAQLQDSYEYYDYDMTCATAIVMGTESTGLTNQWREAADAHIRIPMLGRLDSLNVSVSAAILMYEAVRQRRVNS